MIEAKDLKLAIELHISNWDIISQVDYLEGHEAGNARQVVETKAKIRKAVRESNWEALIIWSHSLEEQTLHYEVYSEMCNERYAEANAELDKQAGRVSA